MVGLIVGCGLQLATANGQSVTPLPTTEPDQARHSTSLPLAGGPSVEMRQAQTRILALNNLGQRSALELAGVEDSRTLAFGIPQDKNVIAAQLRLNLKASAELLENLSHLSILLNDEVVGTLKLPAVTTETGHVTLDLPAQRIKRSNTLTFKLVAHYTPRCEAPRHPSLWLTVLPDSALVLREEHRPLPNDLSLLPAPFFEPVDEAPLKLAFVLPDPTPANLQAAVSVASWFGQLAGYRGVDYTVHTEGLPSGHAIVIAPPESLLPGLPHSNEPAIHMLDNPVDPAGKLLVLTGNSALNIERAARALVLSAPTLSGASVRVKRMTETPRESYDAPAWLPLNRAVALGEWTNTARLSVQGSRPAPIELPLRVAPDLAGWNQPNVPLNLRIHDTVRHGTSPGMLKVYLNRELIEQIDLMPRPFEAMRTTLQLTRPAERDVTVLLPVAALGAQPSLQFQFIYPEPPEAECTYNLTDTRRGAIDPASTLDLRGLTHYLAMPDMASFGNALFPFTRMADLSETRVVLAADSGPETYAALLMLAARAGQSTGHPATGLVVLKDPEPEMLAGHDILILDGGPDTRVLEAWRAHLPAEGSLQARLLPDRPPIAGSLAAAIATVERWLGKGAPAEGQRIETAAPIAAFIAGFESPLTIGRSVVVVSGDSPVALKRIVQRFSTDPEQLQRMQGSAVVLAADTLYTADNERTYHAGVLGPIRSLLWYLGRSPMLLTLLYLAGGLLGSIIIYLALRHRARDRLTT